MQNYARLNKIPIDHLDFEFEITKDIDTAEKKPDYGVLINVIISLLLDEIFNKN